ncbi:MAG: glycosyltransferase family 4 protein [Actinobacteria bacterium]|nr:MAG: glycosyltransferase family 4 protein [Actinomycetota bacterium]
MEQLRIAQISPPWYAIPPTGYGGIELVVSLLADGLVQAGHEVTVFATGDSKTLAKLEYYYDYGPYERILQPVPEVCQVMPAYLRHKEFDVIHDHSGRVGPAIANFVPTPTLHTIHGPFTEEMKEYYRSINHGIYFNAISEYQRSLLPELNYVGTIYNSVNVDWYPFSETRDDYLLFLGRMSPQKGAHIAVEVANRLGMKLIIATKMVEPEEKAYFEEKVKPLLDNNVDILGELDLTTKTDLLMNARCTLFPIQWPEPFGLVMIESMVTGTPVICMRNGSVPEVVEDGGTGFIVDSVDEMAEAVRRVETIDPAYCRQYVDRKFSVPVMVGNYEKAYEKMLLGDVP